MPNFRELSRREFLAQSAALGAAASLPLGALAQEKMRTRTIPGTDESLSVIGLGAPEPFIKMTPEGADLPRSLIQAMVDQGGNLMDTPSFFRPDPPVLGPILTEMGLQDDLFLTGKITVETREEGVAHLEKLVANINKDPMDLLMVHNMRNVDVHYRTLKEWKDAGRTRYIGVSRTRQESYDGLEKFMQAERPDFILTGYSLFHPMAEETALPMAQDLGIAVICAEVFKAGEDGNFFSLVAGKELPEWAAEFDCNSWAQFALKYALGNPAITSVVVETSKVSHVIDNMGAGFGRLPDEAMRKRMREFVATL